MIRTAAFSPATLASVLEQSVDCVKLLGPSGNIRWMNANGRCAMHIEDFATLDGQQWTALWPVETHDAITAAYTTAVAGGVARFDAFCPTARGVPRWWNVTVSSVSDTDGGHAGFLAISRDVTEAETARQAVVVAADELRHRLKNTYAMIGALMLGVARGDPAREAFAEEMVGRMVALSTAQTLFAASDAPCRLVDLIPALVAPFDSPICAVVVEPLPAVVVDRARADAIALVVGELCVNAAKHGALLHGGSVHVAAARHAANVEIVWTEAARQAVAATERDGSQGLKLIDRIVKARQGSLSIAWRSDGPTVRLTFPLA